MRGIYEKVMVTGHRPFKLSKVQQDFMNSALDDIASQLHDNNGMRTMISGMALGADTRWARYAADHGIDLAVYVPFPQQSDKWSFRDRQEWKKILQYSSTQKVFGTTYSPRYLFARNDGMMTDSDLMVAAVSPSLGERTGTMHCIRRAHQKGLPILVLNLDDENLTLVHGKSRKSF